jgi:hypothetical protein
VINNISKLFVHSDFKHITKYDKLCQSIDTQINDNYDAFLVLKFI